MDDRNSKERIMKMAADLFIKFGIRSVSMDDIAYHLGISKKTIYQYFSDKDEIVTLATLHYLGHEKDTVKTLQSKAKDPVDLLIQVSYYLRRNIKETTASLLFELHKYHIKAWRLMEAFRKEFLFEIVKQNLKMGIEQGHFREDLNPDVTSKVRLEESMMIYNEDVFPRNQFNVKEVSDTLLDHFVFAICTEKGKKLYNKYKSQLESNNTLNTLGA